MPARAVALDVSPSSAAIDADVWIPVAASVAQDIVAMGSVYHAAAVLVTSDATQAISQTLAGWGKDIAANKTRGTKARVELRFAKRQDNADTAFEAGAFKYTLTDRSGVSTPSYRRMEALLVRSHGTWRILMERQLDAITEPEWNELPH